MGYKLLGLLVCFGLLLALGVNTIGLPAKLETADQVIASWNTAGIWVSAFIASVGLLVVWRIYESQAFASQRQLIVPLWEHLIKCNDIHLDELVIDDIMSAVRAMELVGLCCEGKMVDKAVVKRTYSDHFIKFYEVIEKIPKVPGWDNKSGKQLLDENRAAGNFYRELIQDRLTRDQLKN